MFSKIVSLVSQESGTDLVTLLEDTERLRKEVKTKDVLLVQNEERLEEINLQKAELENKYNDTLQELTEQKELLEDEKRNAAKNLKVLEKELIRLKAERATKEEIESKEIEIMKLKNKVRYYQEQEKELMSQILDLREKLEANDIGKFEWIAKNLEKQLEGVRQEFERERSEMINNIYKMLKYFKIPENLSVCVCRNV